MSKKKIINLEFPLNRVEGDLDLHIDIEDGYVIDAKSIGTLYRGFENILKGRADLDGLVITPRICGICSITHLNAAVEALENAYSITPPPQAVRLRNLSLIGETLQSDMRQFLLMYMGDFAHKFYKDKPWWEEAKKYYEPFKGESVREALKETTNIVKIVATIGGQWPHTSHMVPGGISTSPTLLDLTLIKNHIDQFALWYSQSVLGIDSEIFLENVLTNEDFLNHIEKYPNSNIARFSRYSFDLGLEKIGQSYQNFLSYGTMQNPLNPSERFIRAGIIQDGRFEPIENLKITEDVSYSFYDDEKQRHPFDGMTKPNRNKDKAYSFSKAPRYNEKVYQTGPLAQAIVNEDKLIKSMYNVYGDSAYMRELARALRPIYYLHYAKIYINDAIKNFDKPTYIKPKKVFEAQGVGFIEAARGGLGHWIKLKDEKIMHYQIITPTAWNGSPKDKDDQYGPWEKALIGVKVDNVEHPMNIGHIVRSFDPCLVCTVHAIQKETKKISSLRIAL